MLSGGTPRELLSAIAAGDTARFQAVPGIGKRTAERIIVELREKVGAAPADEPIVIAARRRPAHARPRRPGRPRLHAPGGRRAARRRRRASTPEDLIAARAQGVAPVSGDPDARRPRAAIQTPAPRAPTTSSTLAAPAAARGLRRPGGAEGAARGLHRGRRRARRGARPRAARRPARPRQDLARADRRRGARRRRSCRPPARRSSARATSPRFLTALEPRSVFFVDEIHRLPRALEETFYPAMEDRQLPITVGAGRGRAGRHARPPAVHADRRHHARRPAHHAAARPLRHPAPARALRRPATSPRSSPLRRHPRRGDRRSTGAARDRRALPRHARASPTGCSSACATSPRSAATGTIDADRPRARRSTCSRSTTTGLDRLDREILHGDLHEVRRRPGRALDARGRGRRGAGHDRGRLRALPAPARLPQAHAARPRAPPRAPSATSGSSRPRSAASLF